MIGTGASAIQIVPELARVAEHLDVYQRSAPWVVGRNDRAYGRLERAALRRLPALRRLYRTGIYWAHESYVPGFTWRPQLGAVAQKGALANLHKAVADPELRARLTPSYRIGRRHPPGGGARCAVPGLLWHPVTSGQARWRPPAVETHPHKQAATGAGRARFLSSPGSLAGSGTEPLSMDTILDSPVPDKLAGWDSGHPITQIPPLSRSAGCPDPRSHMVTRFPR